MDPNQVAQAPQRMEEDKWDRDFYRRHGFGRRERMGKPFHDIDNHAQTNFNWNYFAPSNIPDNRELGHREMKYNYNLLNPGNFSKYWTTGKHSSYEVYQGKDFDGDGLRDYIAVNPENKVVGFNEKYIVDVNKGETPYRRNYYAQDENRRKGQTYVQYLEHVQDNVEGWKDLRNLKNNRRSSPWKVVLTHISDALAAKEVSIKQGEQIAKKLLKCISLAFFAPEVPKYQRKVIVKEAEFKTILKNNITIESIQEFIPEGAIDNICSAMLQGMEGYGDSRILSKLVDWLAANNTRFRLSVEEAENLYNDVISKKAIQQIYKETGINPMNLAHNPGLATTFKQRVEQTIAQMKEKHARQDYGIE